jgi:glycosyltransferase involved in cell wall biosynthesis
MKILLTITTMGVGGAERVLSILADGFARRGHQVTLMTLDSCSGDVFSVSDSVQRIALGLHRPSRTWRTRWYGNLRKIRAMRDAIGRVRPDVVVSFLSDVNILAILACAGRSTPVLVSERVDPRKHRTTRLRGWLRWIAYRRAAGLVVQTHAVAEWLTASRARLPPVTVIPNPVLPPSLPATRARGNGRPYLLAAGRLTWQKGFDVLIRAVALLERAGVDLDLVIAGGGWGEERALQELAVELGVSARVRFVGRVSDLTGWFADAFAFVLSSRYEGFPNVLLEALACGTATIATDCPSGPREILEGGRLGILVPCEDPEAIASAVVSLQKDAALRARLRERGPAVLERFGLDTVTGAWERLMQRTAPP